MEYARWIILDGISSIESAQWDLARRILLDGICSMGATRWNNLLDGEISWTKNLLDGEIYSTEESARQGLFDGKIC